MSISEINGIPIANIATFNGVAISAIDQINGVPVGAAPPVTAGKVAVLPGTSNSYFSTPYDGEITTHGMRVFLFGVTRDGSVGSIRTIAGVWGFSTNQRSWRITYTKDTNALSFQLTGNASSGGSTYSGSYTWEPNAKIDIRCTQFSGGATEVAYRVAGSGSGWIVLDSDSGSPVPVASPSYQTQIGGNENSNLWPGTVTSGRLELLNASNQVIRNKWTFDAENSPDFGLNQTWPSSATGEQWTAQGQGRISAVNELIKDTYTGANGTDITVGYTPDVDKRGGGYFYPQTSSVQSFAIQNNEIQSFANNRNNSPVIETPVGQSNYTVAIDRLAGNGSMGVTIRNSSTGTYAQWRVETTNSGTMGLYEQNSVQATASGADPRSRLWVTCIDDVITAWDATGASLSVSGATSGQTSERVGPHAANSLRTLDNFEVTSITDNPI